MNTRLGYVKATLSAFVLIGTACAPVAPAHVAAPTNAAPGAGQTLVVAPAATTADQPKPGGRLIVGDGSDSKTLQPVISTDTSSSLVWARMYETLIDVDPKTGSPVPRLAEKFEVSPDSKTMTFTLRDGLQWSDGSAFSGDDFAFTVEAVMRSKRTVRKSIFQDIIGAKDYRDGKAESISGIKVDGKTITVQLETAFCPGLINIGGFAIIPRSVFGKYMDPKDASKNIDDAAENSAPTLAMGPFKFKEWVPNDHITLVRNDKFFGGLAYLDEWVRRVYPDANALAAALKTGEIDLGSIEAKDFDALRAVTTLNVMEYPNNGFTYLGWNELRGGKEFFQNKAVRQALAYGLNMDLVIDKVLFGHGQKMVAHTPPTSWAYDSTGLNDYKYDPAKAEQLLDQAGFAKGADGIRQHNGQPLEFTLITNSGNTIRETLIQIAAEQYKQIGVNVTPRTEAFEALVERTDHSKDPTYGEQGGDRQAAYKVLNKQLNEDQPYNFGYSANNLLVASTRVQGIEPGSYSRFAQWNINKWWVLLKP